MTISSPGIGSGLDVTGIVSKLMQIEQQPLVRLQQREAEVQAEISAYGAVKSSLSSLQTAVGKLVDPATFQATKVISSNEDVLKVSSDTNAVTSSYNVTVNRLAQQHKLGSAAFADTVTFGGNAGDGLTLTVGSNSFTLDLSTAMTLSEIQQAINVPENQNGVTAGLVVGDGGNQTLILTSGKTGYDNRIQLSYAGSLDANTFSLSMLNQDATGQLLSSETELDASLTVDGVSVTRSSNTISDAINGITIDLVGSGGANISVEQDTSVALNAVQAFVTAYNNFKDQLAALKDSGASNSVVRGMENQFRGLLNQPISGSGVYSYISELGVTTNADTGKLELDSEQLTTAAQENSASLIDFFTNETSGFAFRANAILDGLVQSDGTIDRIVQGDNDKIDRLQNSQDSMQRRLDLIEKRYMDQFNALDTLMASMTTTSNYLTSQLDSISNLISSNSN